MHGLPPDSFPNPLDSFGGGCTGSSESGRSRMRGVISVKLNGTVRKLRVSTNDSPTSIEHCLRDLFRLRPNARFVLLDGEGVAVPLGLGLLQDSEGGGETSASSDIPVYSMDLLEDSNYEAPRPGPRDGWGEEQPSSFSFAGSLGAIQYPSEAPGPIPTFTSTLTAIPFPNHNAYASAPSPVPEPSPPRGFQEVLVTETETRSLITRGSRENLNSLCSALGSTRMNDANALASASTVAGNSDAPSSPTPPGAQSRSTGLSSIAQDIRDQFNGVVPNLPNSDSPRTGGRVSFNAMPAVATVPGSMPAAWASSRSQTLGSDAGESEGSQGILGASPSGCPDRIRTSLVSLGMPDTGPEVLEEVRFWYDAAAGFSGCRRRGKGKLTKSFTRIALGRKKNNPLELQFGSQDDVGQVDLAAFDSSDQRVTTLYSQWVSETSGTLYPEALRYWLEEEFSVNLSGAQFAEGLRRVLPAVGRKASDKPTTIDPMIFRYFFQRIMLGAACRRSKPNGPDEPFDEDVIQLTEYGEQEVETVFLPEEVVLFKSPLRIPGRSKRAPGSRWVRSTATNPERLLRLGVKFYLHPIAVSDAIMAAKVGMTRIDRYNHQYFVSLEMYAFLRDDTKTRTSFASFMTSDSEERAKYGGSREEGPPIVSSRVQRSVLFIVATGNPKEQCRNWLISVVSNRHGGTEDPLDFFQSGDEAANQVLDTVHDDLQANTRMREYKADFLLYAIIDRAARETTPICIAYGHRLRWLEERLGYAKLAMEADYINEASNIRLELRELRQWLNQMRGILKTLSADYKAIDQKHEISWNFGAHSHKAGRNLLLFLSSTDAHLEQSMERLTTLDELAKSFLDKHQRHTEGFMNNILLTLTVATAVFMPAQLLAGIYGTNFVSEDGTPSIPELKWEHGYAYFLTSCAAVISLGLFLAYFCLRGTVFKSR